MASARIHEAIAKVINLDYNMDEILLMIGTVAPDCWRNDKVGIKDKYFTHFWDYRVKDGQANNYEEFYFKYYHQLSNPIYFGYLIHLIADQYWKTYIDPKYEMVVDGIRGYKMKDGHFHSAENWFGYYEGIKLQKQLAKKFNLGYLPTTEEEIPNFSCTIEEFNLSGLFGPNGTLNYINSELSPTSPDEDSQIYDINDIITYINETVNFIKDELQRLKKLYQSESTKYKIAITINNTIISTNSLEEVLEENNLSPKSSKESKLVPIDNEASSCINSLLEHDCIVDLLTVLPIDTFALVKKSIVKSLTQNSLHYHHLNNGLSSTIAYLKENNYNVLIDNDINRLKEAASSGLTTILYGPYNPEYQGYQASNWSDILSILNNIIHNPQIKLTNQTI